METRIDEIAPDVYRLSTLIDAVAPPAGFTFNQFLVRDEQPFLFHTGMRGLFPLVSEAVRSLVPLDDLRWIGFAHIEADECGAMNDFLAVSPQAQVVHSGLACMLSTSGRTACGSCRRRTCRTTGRAASGSTRPPARCSPATC
jgi:flavorubredoxin